MSGLPDWRYRLALVLASPLITAHLLLRSFRDGGTRYLKERLGFVSHHGDVHTHIHMASVGEAITAGPLIDLVRERHPNRQLLLTTNTPTGLAILDKYSNNNTHVSYLPIDFKHAVARFLKNQNIKQLWIIETEIWPWLYSMAAQNNTATTIVNARMSARSEGRLAALFQSTYQRVLKNVTVLARSDKDADRFIKKGARKNLTRTVGNLKFAHTNVGPTQSRLIQQHYCLAASTHDDEELQLAQSWLQADNLGLLVIAPRHIERANNVYKALLALQHDIHPDLPAPKRRSLGEQPTTNCRLYLADSLGELVNWYRFSTAAFVGGSLIQRGGHNMLEAVRAETVTIVGPNTTNFEEEMTLLTSCNGVAIANSADEVIHFFQLAMTKKDWAEGMKKRASNALEGCNDVVERYSYELSV